MNARYSVQYGLGRNLQHEDFFDSVDAAVSKAEDLLHAPFCYLFSFVYDTRARGDAQLVWDYRNGYNPRYTG